jgi:uncharacterized protein
MTLQNQWPLIRATFDASIRSSLHCAVASVRDDGSPHVTPIGHMFLRDDCTAYYFEEHTKRLPENLTRDPRVCVMFVRSDRWFWARSLFRGRFAAPPGVRLFGVAGERRPASADEIAAYLARVRPFRKLAGYALIWKDLTHVRDLVFERCEPVRYPVMTDGLWL